MVPCRWEDRPQVWGEAFRALFWFERHGRALRSSDNELVNRARTVMLEQVFEDHSQPRRTA